MEKDLKKFQPERISKVSGFNNYFSFEKSFKDKNGISPTEYRKKNT